MRQTFPSDILGKKQLVHLTDPIWIREQTGYVLKLRPESETFRCAIQHFHGFSFTDIELNGIRDPIKPIVKHIIHFYVKIISISMNKVGQDLNVVPPERNLEEEFELGLQEPFDYLDEHGFEDYSVSMMNWKIETPYILKTIYKIMLNKPSCKPIKDILIYLYKRQPETPPPMSLELPELWMKFVERILESYDGIVLENEQTMALAPQIKKPAFEDKTSFPSLEMFQESFSYPVWINILDSLEEIQKFTSQIKREPKYPGRVWSRIFWYDKRPCRPSVPLPVMPFV